MDDTEPLTAEYYRDRADEIRLLSRLSKSPQVIGELLETAKRFDRMAEYAERRALK
jgi:hypothetical protein